MTREEAIKMVQAHKFPKPTEKWQMLNNEAIDMAIEALSANATVAKIQIDDIDKAKTSSQLLDDLAVDMVNAMGKRIVEVVRCKDCRWWNGSQETMHNNHLCRNWSKFGSINTSADDFCSYGERREPSNG